MPDLLHLLWCRSPAPRRPPPHSLNRHESPWIADHSTPTRPWALAGSGTQRRACLLSLERLGSAEAISEAVWRTLQTDYQPKRKHREIMPGVGVCGLGVRRAVRGLCKYTSSFWWTGARRVRPGTRTGAGATHMPASPRPGRPSACTYLCGFVDLAGKKNPDGAHGFGGVRLVVTRVTVTVLGRFSPI